MYKKKPNFVTEFKDPTSGEKRITDYVHKSEVRSSGETSFLNNLDFAIVCLTDCLYHLENVLPVINTDPLHSKETKKIISVRKKVQKSLERANKAKAVISTIV